MTTLPEEAVKAAKDVLYYANPNDVERALTAALPFLPVQVAVKKLEWTKGVVDIASPHPGMKYVACSTTPKGSWAFWLDHAPETRSVFTSEEAAKAAAQADYSARILSALEPSALDMGNPITLTYTNYRGETSERAITPIRPWFGSTEWHPEPQWLLRAYDHDKGAERDFALKDFGRQQQSAARELALEEHLHAIEQQLVVNLEYFHDEKRILLETLQSHIISHISAIRTLSSPGHANAGKVEGNGCPGVKGVIPTKFGESICFSGIDDARLILVSVCGNSGLVPVKYLLPHQLYMHDVQKLSEQGEVLVCAVPVYDQQIHVTSALPSAPASEGVSNV